MSDKLFDTIFNLKFTAKQLQKEAVKQEKEAKSHRSKAMKSKEAGNMDACRLYCQVMLTRGDLPVKPWTRPAARDSLDLPLALPIRRDRDLCKGDAGRRSGRGPSRCTYPPPPPPQHSLTAKKASSNYLNLGLNLEAVSMNLEKQAKTMQVREQAPPLLNKVPRSRRVRAARRSPRRWRRPAVC